MNIYLDDERPCPAGWVAAKTAPEAIALLKHNTVGQISLDHDLGEGNGNGNDVLLWIEEMVFTKGYRAPTIFVHSANSSAAAKMKAGILVIEREMAMQESEREMQTEMQGESR